MTKQQPTDDMVQCPACSGDGHSPNFHCSYCVGIGGVSEDRFHAYHDRNTAWKTGRCETCNGDRGWDIPHGYDPRDGSQTTHWQECSDCDATGLWMTKKVDGPKQARRK